MRVLVTGANGFVGRRLCALMTERGYFVRAAFRHNVEIAPQSDNVLIDDVGPQTDWSASLKYIDVIIHLAARVHVMKEMSANPIEQYRHVNVEGTRRLASMAIQAGVKRIVYVSTIKVNGESTLNKSFTENDQPSPRDPYSISKWEAEEVLRDLSDRHGIEIVIIRPPLVYGPRVKGNMLRLMQYIDRGYPLPFGGIKNRRSLISLDNLIDVLILSAAKPESAGNTFLVSDGLDLSTPDLIERISESMGRESKLIKFPDRTFSFIAGIIPALRPVIERLTGSLVIDVTKFRNMFSWNPPQLPSEGIKSMVSDYLQSKSCKINNGSK